MDRNIHGHADIFLILGPDTPQSFRPPRIVANTSVHYTQLECLVAVRVLPRTEELAPHLVHSGWPVSWINLSDNDNPPLSHRVRSAPR